MIEMGVRPGKIIPVFYGDSRPFKETGRSREEIKRRSRRVEFVIRKKGIGDSGRKIP
jgi:hypothetical protein